MSLPDQLQQLLSEKYHIRIDSVYPLSGGSINQAARLQTNQGNLFLKWNRQAPADMFDREASGLDLLRQADTDLYIPEVITYNDIGDELPGFLLMTFIDPQRGTREASENFGKELVRLHQHTSDQFGLDHDNYIGKLPQSNKKHDNWIDFYRTERIEPQIKMAIDSSKMSPSINKYWENLASQLDDIFPNSKPSLLHGDLWGGNYFFDKNGRTVLIDPAVYYGHHEMELAFTRMFGGFSDLFYDAYSMNHKLEPGFPDRIAIYNLYPLLVHVNMFGGHYVSQAESLLKRY